MDVYDDGGIGCGIFIGIICFIILGIAIGVISSNKEIISETKIIPEIKLIIKDNKVDTLYVYKPLK